ncbi:MAG: hypothetical protein Q9159_002631 [Coniocarpon cinnabarinum]
MHVGPGWKDLVGGIAQHKLDSLSFGENGRHVRVTHEGCLFILLHKSAASSSKMYAKVALLTSIGFGLALAQDSNNAAGQAATSMGVSAANSAIQSVASDANNPAATSVASAATSALASDTMNSGMSTDGASMPATMTMPSAGDTSALAAGATATDASMTADSSMPPAGSDAAPSSSMPTDSGMMTSSMPPPPSATGDQSATAASASSQSTGAAPVATAHYVGMVGGAVAAAVAYAL